MRSGAINWRQIARCSVILRPLALSALVMLAAEFVLGPTLANVLPSQWYLNLYLPWQTQMHTRNFLDRQLEIVPDHELGWRAADKRPSKGPDLRSAAPHHKDHPGPKRLVFVGDSRIRNLVSDVLGPEKRSKYLTRGIEIIDRSAIYYALDQTYLALKRSAEKDRPAVAVVGIDTGGGDLLQIHYVPLADRLATDMPGLKPRFQMIDGGLMLIKPNNNTLLRPDAGRTPLMPFLAEHDPGYNGFRQFQYWQSTPLLALISLAREEIGQLRSRLPGQWQPAEGNGLQNADLFSALISEIRLLGNRKNITIVFLLFPDQREFKVRSDGSYGQLRALLAHHGVRFIDTRMLFGPNADPNRLYADQVHYSPMGNARVAHALRPFISVE